MKFSLLRFQIPFVIAISAVACVIAICTVLLISEKGSQFGLQEIVDGSLQMGTKEFIKRFMIQ